MENHIILTTVLQHTTLPFIAPRPCNSLLPHLCPPPTMPNFSLLSTPGQHKATPAAEAASRTGWVQPSLPCLPFPKSGF